ncbi:NAD(P)H-dependent glycerol-3-phosphate dehydrogenase [Mycoplasma iguanae]|uniref:Glycerol-3-phosphate dehydrogenase [NAD(P)+] n=1 Tax=Mycoplasma iguanae TaxID=292461 RepID=A0ABY5R7T0_9MOLU|nr:NAD(P)H-dependent glycerol-3-phosphate dehydrogenase [Mycoplasma iguanae]UVD81544.1 NAD(P)H-dependent glycerol-3-phosphate dehydrogenase [Mycoplasma iguanae]
MSKIAIIGSGAMATAMAQVAHDAGQKNIILYGIDKQELNDLAQGKNLKYFPENTQLAHFQVTDDLKFALDQAKYVILAVPSKIMDQVFEKVLAHLNSEVIIINVAKGFYPSKNVSLQQGLKIVAKDNQFIKGVVSLSGPSHAEEIVKRKYTAISVISANLDLAKKIQNMLSNKYFKLYCQTDETGAEIAGAYKNILAIGSGILFALDWGINTVAAFLTRGLSEAQRLIIALGGKPETILGLTGIGDLIVTALSNLSRNYNFGQAFVKEGKKALESNHTIEGLTALKNVLEIAQTLKLDLPIAQILNQVIYHGLKLTDAMDMAWQRELKSE